MRPAVDVPLVPPTKVEKTTLLEICWPLRLPRHSIAYRLVRSDLPVRPRTSISLIPYRSSSPYQRACVQTGLDTLSSLRLAITVFFRIPRIQLEQPPGRATYSILYPLLRFGCLPLNLICNPETTNSEDSER
jgi:hypothetical protein